MRAIINAIPRQEKRSLYAFLPFALMIPVLLFIAWAIPKVQFWKMNRESVVERIRQQ